MKTFAAFCVLTVACGLVGLTCAPTVVARNVIEPYVEVRAGDSIGAGTVVKIDGKMHVLTAKHMVHGVKAMFRQEIGDNTVEYQGRHVRSSKIADLALYSLLDPSGLVPATVLEGSVKPGEPCFYIGTPFALHASLELSIINRVRWRAPYDDRLYFVVNGNGYHGNSGGGAYVKREDKWKLAGVVVGPVNWHNPRTALRVVPPDQIRAFLKEKLCVKEP